MRPLNLDQYQTKTRIMKLSQLLTKIYNQNIGREADWTPTSETLDPTWTLSPQHRQGKDSSLPSTFKHFPLPNTGPPHSTTTSRTGWNNCPTPPPPRPCQCHGQSGIHTTPPCTCPFQINATGLPPTLPPAIVVRHNNPEGIRQGWTHKPCLPRHSPLQLRPRLSMWPL